MSKTSFDNYRSQKHRLINVHVKNIIHRLSISKTSYDSRGCQKHGGWRGNQPTVQYSESAALIVGALTNTRGGLAAAGASVTHRAARGCACAWGDDALSLKGFG